MILHDHKGASADPLAFTRQNCRLNAPSVAIAINRRFDLCNIGPVVQGSGVEAVVAPEVLRDASEVVGEEYHLLSDVLHWPGRVELHKHELISFESTAATDMALRDPQFKPKLYSNFNVIKALSAAITATNAATTEGSDNG